MSITIFPNSLCVAVYVFTWICILQDMYTCRSLIGYMYVAFEHVSITTVWLCIVQTRHTTESSSYWVRVSSFEFRCISVKLTCISVKLTCDEKCRHNTHPNDVGSIPQARAHVPNECEPVCGCVNRYMTYIRIYIEREDVIEVSSHTRNHLVAQDPS